MKRDQWAGFARVVGLVAAVALVLRLVYVVVVEPQLGYDGTWYALQAGTIGDGIGYVDPLRYYSFQGRFATAHFPPLWPGLLSVVFDLGWGTRTAYRVTGAVVGTVTVVLTAYLGRSLLGDRVGIAAAVIVALSPFMIAADGSLMAESLFTALVTAAVLVAIAARRRGRLGWFAGLGFLLGLATLTRGDGLVVAVVLLPVVAWGSPRTWPRRLEAAGVALGVVAVTLAPWAVRNLQQLDDLVVLSSNSGTLVAGANCAAVYGDPDLAGWDAACARAAAPRRGTEIDRAEAQRDVGTQYVRDHWVRAAFVAPLRVIRGWGIWEPGALVDAEAGEGRVRAVQWVGWAVSLAVLGAAAVGTVQLLRARAEVAELLAVVGAASLVLLTSWGNQRFRIVATPELAVLAAYPVVQALARRRRRSGAPGPAAAPVSP